MNKKRKNKDQLHYKKVDVFKGKDGKLYEKKVFYEEIGSNKESKGINSMTFESINSSNQNIIIKLLLLIFLLFRKFGLALLEFGAKKRESMDEWDKKNKVKK